MDLFLAQELEIVRQPGRHGQLLGHIERKKPALVVRLQRNDIIDGLTDSGEIRRDRVYGSAGRPGMPVENPQYRPAPVHLVASRDPVIVGDTKCDRFRQDQPAQASRGHAVIQTGARIRILRQTPQRSLHARE